jgi:hypothetical protein
MRNVLRVVVIAGFYGCVALGLARLIWADQPAMQARAYLALMAIVGLAAVTAGFLLRIGRCPVCGHVFAVRADCNSRNNIKRRNNFTSQCLNCGLRLDGSNAADYAAATTRTPVEDS